jgi:hypothetical protein
MEGVWTLVSRDIYKLDEYHHGAPHVDRYRRRNNIGRYRLDGSPITHFGVIPPPIPHADRERFAAEAAKAKRPVIRTYRL